MDFDTFIDEFKKYAARPEQETASGTFHFIRRAFRSENNEVNPQLLNLVKKAFDFSKSAHEGQKRMSGEPYFQHSYKTALKLIEWRLDPQTIIAGLLHDTIEDTPYDLEKIKNEFGEEISFLVEGVTKLGHLKYRGAKARAENLRKMILALSQDLRVVLIKLADRLHNMKTLSAIPPQKQKRIALETYEIYATLAYRLGMQGLAGELQDLSFPYLYPEEYKWLTENVKERYEERVKYLEKVRPILEKALGENGIEIIKIDSRAKRYASLYRKLKRHEMNLDLIYDLVAERIIVKTIEDCYAALGIIHQMWPPLPGRIKDYIALPKPNGYQSLHTTVFCVDNKPTEFQIRTQKMNEEAELGIAAHWVYEEEKENSESGEKKVVFGKKRELGWVKQLREWQKDFPDSEEFIDSLKIDFFKDRIFAVTPKGEVIDLPAESTPIDFAYHVHSEIGDQAAGARVNNKIAPLDYKLSSGDVVEIIIQKNKKPSESWLSFVKSEAARKKIQAYLREKKSVKMEPHKPMKRGKR
ncbi:bifunctional (p)ppGpp synthetase/guanosine-3',5'-bis(diphosphate) 3'-pyrophosphohydrolase [Candidatus Wolfebacteria bacterium]|nr:bifunctional (p)ppGpp synthetase/guanosine-3',5'-bis(diphosphate) 3'-pyrophosphohydrolase [Candidatus Wolfebacteria bacterium]